MEGGLFCGYLFVCRYLAACSAGAADAIAALSIWLRSQADPAPITASLRQMRRHARLVWAGDDLSAIAMQGGNAHLQPRARLSLLPTRKRLMFDRDRDALANGIGYRVAERQHHFRQRVTPEAARLC
ncbi:hypothetical protein ASJ34_19165 [Xanthomonas campestris pv. campestris]|nr:hypothetical protein ASJ34_19165 [Xanthomonas campestris pv. campestris]